MCSLIVLLFKHRFKKSLQLSFNISSSMGRNTYYFLLKLKLVKGRHAEFFFSGVDIDNHKLLNCLSIGLLSLLDDRVMVEHPQLDNCRL